MISYEDAKRTILSKYPDSIILASYRSLDRGYIFALKPKDWPEDQLILDPYFKVSSNGKISEFSFGMDPEASKKIRKNRIK